MFVSRTPLRVSLFGGGTDYPSFFKEHGGCCINLTIQKYIYICLLDQSNSKSSTRYRLSYSAIEDVAEIDQIEHPAIREALRLHPSLRNLQLSVLSDMPAGAGLGSSSAFCVGLLGLLSFMKGQDTSKKTLANQATNFEQNVLNENVGNQDQVSTAFGGFNKIEFGRDDFSVTPISMNCRNRTNFSKSMFLVNSFIRRRATDVAAQQVMRIDKKEITTSLLQLKDIVAEAQNILEGKVSSNTILEIGRLLNESWELKRSLTGKVSSQHIDELYAKCLEHGGIGGKLLGAGGGGFLLVIVPRENQRRFIDAFKSGQVHPVELDHNGAVFKNI